MKKIIAFFDNNDNATSTANTLCNKFSGKDISVSMESAEDARLSQYAYSFTAFGAAAGIILGLLAGVIRGIGFFGTISPVTGLICGSVIGAIVGCLFDILFTEETPHIPKLTLSAPTESCGRISRVMKKRGAIAVFIGK